MSQTIIASIVLLVAVTLVLVALLLIVKNAITPKGTVKIDINDGKKELNVAPGGNLMATLAKYSPPKRASSTASRSRTAGVWAAR